MLSTPPFKLYFEVGFIKVLVGLSMDMKMNYSHPTIYQVALLVTFHDGKNCCLCWMTQVTIVRDIITAFLTLLSQRLLFSK